MAPSPTTKQRPGDQGPGRCLISRHRKKERTQGIPAVGDLTARSRQGRYRKRQAECRHLDPRELTTERGGQGRRGGIPQENGTKSSVGFASHANTGRSGARRWNGSSYPTRGGERDG